jgi:hypothetical protein
LTKYAGPRNENELTEYAGSRIVESTGEIDGPPGTEYKEKQNFNGEICGPTIKEREKKRKERKKNYGGSATICEPKTERKAMMALEYVCKA